MELPPGLFVGGTYGLTSPDGVWRRIGAPIPAARSVSSSGPRPAQQSARRPSTITAGTDRIPSFFARAATAESFMSSTWTSHEGQPIRRTNSTALRQSGHPALKISTLRLVFMAFTSFFPLGKDLFVILFMESSHQPLRGRHAGCLPFDGIGAASVERWVVLPARLDVHAVHADRGGSEYRTSTFVIVFLLLES